MKIQVERDPDDLLSMYNTPEVSPNIRKLANDKEAKRLKKELDWIKE